MLKRLSLSEWLREQEDEEKASARQEGLDEWGRIAKMLRDLECIKGPVMRSRKVITSGTGSKREYNLPIVGS